MKWNGIELLGGAYHVEDDVVIYNADCRDILPLLPKVDLVLTDPPYGIGERTGTVSIQRSYKNDYTLFTDDTEYIKEVVIPIIEHVIKTHERVILTPGAINMMLYQNPDGFGVFYQPATTALSLWGRADAQPILYYGRPYDIGKTIKSCSYKLIEKPSNKEHPCAKPINIWTKILSDRSDVNHIILDPFLGSGTTAVAAKKLGRKCIGIEIEEKYCKIAVDRLRQSVMRFE